MKDIEGKIKAFLDDEQKVKALASDEVFIEKVARGTATYETYGEEFKKLGLDLSDEEAKEVRRATTGFLDTPIEKLADISLEGISGGLSDGAVLAMILGGAVSLVMAAEIGLGCSVAGLVCYFKGKKAIKQGDKAKAEKYSNAGKKLAIAAGSCAGIVVPAGIVAAVGWRSWD